MSGTKIALRKAIKQLYDTFEKYPKPDPTDREYPLTGEDKELYLQSELKNMPIHLISHRLGFFYYIRADEFRYYLPRLFETQLEHHEFVIQNHFRSLALWDWLSWSEEEREAIDSYLQAMFDFVMQDYEPKSNKAVPLDEVARVIVVGLSGLYHEITPFLQKWEQATETQATLHIMWFLEDWWRDAKFYRKKPLLRDMPVISEPYATMQIQNRDILFSWLASSTIGEKLKKLSSFKPDDNVFQHSLEKALDAHEYLNLNR